MAEGGYTRKPVPIDDQNWRLLDRCSEVFTNRFTIGAGNTSIFMAYDFKVILIHYESGTTLFTLRGSIPGRKWFFTETASVTADGGNHTTLHSTGHGFTAGDSVQIVGCVKTTDHTTVLVPDGTYVLQAGSHDADHIEVHSTYIAGTPDSTGYIIGYRDAVLTSDGYTLQLPLVATAGAIPFYLATSCTVSVICGR